MREYQSDMPSELLEFKTQLRQLIHDMGLSQGQFARQLGVQRRAVCRWLSMCDTTIPHEKTLNKLKKLFAHKAAKQVRIEKESTGKVVGQVYIPNSYTQLREGGINE